VTITNGVKTSRKISRLTILWRALRRSVRNLCSTAAPCAHTLHNSAREK
jgi:hypothetical protein